MHLRTELARRFPPDPLDDPGELLRHCPDVPGTQAASPPDMPEPGMAQNDEESTESASVEQPHHAARPLGDRCGFTPSANRRDNAASEKLRTTGTGRFGRMTSSPG